MRLTVELQGVQLRDARYLVIGAELCSDITPYQGDGPGRAVGLDAMATKGGSESVVGMLADAYEVAGRTVLAFEVDPEVLVEHLLPDVPWMALPAEEDDE